MAEPVDEFTTKVDSEPSLSSVDWLLMEWWRWRVGWVGRVETIGQVAALIWHPAAHCASLKVLNTDSGRRFFPNRLARLCTSQIDLRDVR